MVDPLILQNVTLIGKQLVDSLGIQSLAQFGCLYLNDFSNFEPRIGPRDGSKAQSAPPVEKYVQISPTLSPIAVGPDAVDALSNNSFLHGSASTSAPAAAPAGEPADV